MFCFRDPCFARSGHDDWLETFLILLFARRTLFLSSACALAVVCSSLPTHIISSSSSSSSSSPTPSPATWPLLLSFSPLQLSLSPAPATSSNMKTLLQCSHQSSLCSSSSPTLLPPSLPLASSATSHLAESLQASPTHAGSHPLELYARALFQILHHATHIAPHRSPSAARVTYNSFSSRHRDTDTLPYHARLCRCPRYAASIEHVLSIQISPPLFAFKSCTLDLQDISYLFYTSTQLHTEHARQETQHRKPKLPMRH
ncbi:hypothetical protein BC835DRAFT_575360 [Cytidiella melzeri]|nr:hypothetical protein BC835DRAFT_575360 [Cytidiella melzeri]